MKRRNRLVFAVVASALGLAFYLAISAFISDEEIVRGLLLAGVLLLALVIYLRRKVRYPLPCQLLWVAFLALAGFRLLSHYFLPHLVQPDEFLYDDYGWYIAHSLRTFHWPALPSTDPAVNLYSLLTGSVYSVAGHSLYAMQVVNAAFVVLGLASLAKATARLSGWEASSYVVVLAMMYPAMYWHGTAHLREGAIFFLVALAVEYLVKAFADDNLKYWICVGVISIVIFALRPVVAAVLFPCFGSIYGLYVIRKRRHWLTILVVSVGLIVTLFPAYDFVVRGVLASHEMQLARSSDPLQYLSTVRESRSGIDSPERLPPLSDWSSLYSTIPRAAFRFTFWPYPWDVDNYAYLLGVLDATYVLMLVVLAAIHLVWGFPLQRPVVFSFIAQLVLSSCLMGVVDTSVGAVTRHRMIFAVLLVVPVAAMFAKSPFVLALRQALFGRPGPRRIARAARNHH